ncbi:MAG: HD domain-containing protein [Nanoarchaeota archaeon]|nr:HD domain-containing protein [Nanoarchaeota archaeon]
MNLPSKDECFELLKEWHVPNHVMKHILKVNKVAVFLGEKFKEKGYNVNIDLLDRASLLHDILRVCNFKKIDPENFEQEITEEDMKIWEKVINEYGDIHHAKAGYKLLKKDYPEVANLVKKHNYKIILDKNNCPKTLNEKIMFYSDKRVMHDQVVMLKDRADDGHKRNPHLHDSNETEKADILIRKLEEELFSKLDIDPKNLLKLNDDDDTN